MLTISFFSQNELEIKKFEKNEKILKFEKIKKFEIWKKLKILKFWNFEKNQKILKKIKKFWNLKFRSLFNFEVVLEKIFCIFEHDYADGVEICNSRFIFAYASFLSTTPSEFTL